MVLYHLAHECHLAQVQGWSWHRSERCKGQKDVWQSHMLTPGEALSHYLRADLSAQFNWIESALQKAGQRLICFHPCTYRVLTPSGQCWAQHPYTGNRLHGPDRLHGSITHLHFSTYLDHEVRKYLPKRLPEARETAQWIKVLTTQAWRPKFRSHIKPDAYL